MGKQILIRNVRMSFPHIETPQEPKADAKPGTVAKYNGCFIFPKDHPAMEEIKNLIRAEAVSKWKEKSSEVLKVLKAQDKLPYHDGDLRAQYTGFAGNLFIAASNKKRPTLLNRQRVKLEKFDPELFYSGGEYNILVSFWPQDNKDGGKRINAELHGIQFVAAGEQWGGGGGSVASGDEFDILDEGDDDGFGESTSQYDDDL